MSHKIFVADGLAPEGLALLKTAGDVTADNKITAADLAAVLPEYDALVVRSRTKVNAALLAAGPKLIGCWRRRR
jgi:D-3-phosphoglycerate dehydrogenase